VTRRPGRLRAVRRRVLGPALAVPVCLPGFVHHLLGRPHRRGRQWESAGSWRGALLRAAYDVLVDCLVRAYQDLEHVRLPDGIGALGVRFNRLGMAVDDEIERRLADGSPIGRSDVLGLAPVERAIAELVECALGIGDLDCVARARATVLDEFDSGFTDYIGLVRKLHVRSPAADVLRAAVLDSGGQLRCLAIVWGLVGTCAVPSEHTVAQFEAFGVLAKFVDDIRDVRVDVRAARPNLVIAFQNAALGASVTEPFWAEFDTWQERLTSRQLRVAVDLMLLSTWSTRSQPWSAGRS
jgi:hypothetical protein